MISVTHTASPTCDTVDSPLPIRDIQVCCSSVSPRRPAASYTVLNLPLPETETSWDFWVEAQFFQNEEIIIAQTFHARIDPTRTPRDMAIQRAEDWRKGSGSARAIPDEPWPHDKCSGTGDRAPF
jgi:hypothetical protein